MQSSVAVRASGGPWLLVNASPDVRQQLELLQPVVGEGLRSHPVAAVLLTDGEIDHTAGLLVLREAGERLRVYASAPVARGLEEGLPLLRVLDAYCGVEVSVLEPGVPAILEGGLEVEPFDAGGHAPRYVGGGPTTVLGLTFREAARTLTYAPALAALGPEILARLEASDCVLVDGTFWRDDELPALGIGNRTARAMGHLPLSGPGGTLEALSRLQGSRRILVHVNNTNPVLLEDSDERLALEAAGVEVGYDGLEVIL
jgi:pyrroloquinoline quinone biosynthesis protein B